MLIIFIGVEATGKFNDIINNVFLIYLYNIFFLICLKATLIETVASAGTCRQIIFLNKNKLSNTFKPVGH